MEFLLANPLLLMLIIALPLMMLFSRNARKKLEAQQAQRDSQMREDMQPGVWVMTASGFWGRFVDIDGETVILETPDGTETYWKFQAIANVGGSPFPEDDTEHDSDEEEAEETVLGLSEPETSNPTKD